jgi:hypothetical protein
MFLDDHRKTALRQNINTDNGFRKSFSFLSLTGKNWKIVFPQPVPARDCHFTLRNSLLIKYRTVWKLFVVVLFDAREFFE